MASSSASSPDSSSTWRLGAVIGRRYRLDGELGRGGFGTVFRATRLDDRAQVALKLLASSKRHDDTAVARFSREAELAVRLRSPCTVRALDYGDAGDGTPFIVFELLEGTTLEAWLAPRGAITPGEALSVMLALLSSLEEAHALGIVHRDIKPANVLVRPGSEDGTIKLLDFGIAKVQDEEAALTREGFIIGTAAYMAPEQIDGAPVGPATDLYAAALVLAEMITGAPLYEGESMAICLRKLKEGRVPLPDAVVMSPFGVVIERATRRAPEARYRSAAEMRSALVQAGVVARPLGAAVLHASAAAPFASTALAAPIRATASSQPAPVPAHAAPAHAASKNAHLPAADRDRPRGPRAALFGAALASGVALLGGAAFVWRLQAGPDPEPAEPSAPRRAAVSSVAAPAPAPSRGITWKRCDRAPRDERAAIAALADEAKPAGFQLLDSGDAFDFFKHAFEVAQRDNADWYAVRTLKRESLLFGTIAVYGSKSAERLQDLAQEMPIGAHLSRSPDGTSMIVLFGLSPADEARFRARLCGDT